MHLINKNSLWHPREINLFNKWCTVLLLVPDASTNLFYRVKWKGSSPSSYSSTQLPTDKQGMSGTVKPCPLHSLDLRIIQQITIDITGFKTSSSVRLRDLHKWYYGILHRKTITPQYILVMSTCLYEYNDS